MRVDASLCLKEIRAPLVDDLTYLRRLSVDLNGRIPTENEINEFLALPAGTRRAVWVDKLLQRDQFADRWTVFFSLLFVINTIVLLKL